MKGLLFLTCKDAYGGFTLAGAEQRTVKPEGAETALRQALSDPDTGVVVIDERLRAAIPELHFDEMEKHWAGLLVTLPAPEPFAAVEADYLQRLIQRTLGYHVRLNL